MSEHIVYTGYAIFTEKYGYVSIYRSFWDNELCFVVCRDQKSPAIVMTMTTAERLKTWMENTFPESKPVIIPLRYSEGMWLDFP